MGCLDFLIVVNDGVASSLPPPSVIIAAFAAVSKNDWLGDHTKKFVFFDDGRSDLLTSGGKAKMSDHVIAQCVDV